MDARAFLDLRRSGGARAHRLAERAPRSPRHPVRRAVLARDGRRDEPDGSLCRRGHRPHSPDERFRRSARRALPLPRAEPAHRCARSSVLLSGRSPPAPPLCHRRPDGRDSGGGRHDRRTTRLDRSSPACRRAVKFAFIVTNLAGGGAEKTVLKLGSALAGRGHEVHLVLLEHHVEHAVPAGIRLHALTSRGRRLLKGAVGKLLAVLRLRHLFSMLARPRPFDLIVSTLPFADEVAVRARLPRHWCRIANTLSAEIARLNERDP